MATATQLDLELWQADGFAALATAILLQCVADVQESNGHAAEAQTFMMTGGADWLASLLNVQPANWQRMRDALTQDGDFQLELGLD